LLEFKREAHDLYLVMLGQIRLWTLVTLLTQVSVETDTLSR